MFSHAICYERKGKMVVEALSNYYLINSNVSLGSKASNDINQKKNPGDNVLTTLDVTLQQVASNALGVYKGAIIVTEVSTVKILAMVSKPDFDPNEINNIWTSLVSDTESSVLLNIATQGF